MGAFGDWLAQGGFQVTGGRRDPNSRLGRANPKSWHNRGQLYDEGFGAFDVRPRKDMTFDQFRQKAEADGWNVREAIDEVKNPSRHATGPHRHMAVDGRKEQQPMATSLSSLMQNNPADQPPKVAGMAVPGAEPMSLASYLQAPLTNEPLQSAIMPGDQPEPEFVPMSPLPGVKPKGRGTANDIMGSIFDVLAAAGGGQPTYWAGVLDHQQRDEQQRQELAERQAAAAQKQAERHATLQDWMFQRQYERANPAPNSMETDLSTWNRWSPEQRDAYATMQDVRSPIAVSRPDGSVVRVPRDFGAPQQGGNNLRAEAEAAIAAGANPETVWARYRQMGGQ